MPTEGAIQGTIGWLRVHQQHNLNAMAICDAYEALQNENRSLQDDKALLDWADDQGHYDLRYPSLRHELIEARADDR